jgi:hypothetical protein
MAGEALADEVRLVEGGYSYTSHFMVVGDDFEYDETVTEFSLSGKGFSFLGKQWIIDVPCHYQYDDELGTSVLKGCLPGEQFDTRMDTFFDGNSSYEGEVHIDGLSSNSADELHPRGYTEFFTAVDTIIIPRTDAQSLTFTMPYSLNGGAWISNCGSSPDNCETFAEIEFRGRGTGVWTFSKLPDTGAFRFESFSYVNKPTPEPATMLLLGTGLAGLGGVIRRRRRSK